jgi:hypothetical protein
MGEVADLLRSHGISQSSEDEEHVYFRMTDDAASLHRHLSTSDCTIEPRAGAELVEIAVDDVQGVVERILHKLHQNQIILIPVGKWRSIFDAVAFSLAGNDEWQVIDAAATVELNSRDPLLSDTGDLHLLCALLKALMQDSETPDQGLTVITAGVPIAMEIVPSGGIRMSFGNKAVAEEIAEACNS